MRVSGFLGLVCLNAKLLERRLGAPSREEQDKADGYCKDPLRNPHVRAAIYAVYDPASPRLPSRSNTLDEGDSRKPADAAVELWGELDPQTFEYFKADTTSFILTCHKRKSEDQSGHLEDLVLKCVLFPWNTVTPVATSTADYASHYGAARTSQVVVHPKASTANWVVMPFQEGPTLYEHLSQFEKRKPARHERVREARDETEILLLKFIDLGRNHLYSRQVGSPNTTIRFTWHPR